MIRPANRSRSSHVRSLMHAHCRPVLVAPLLALLLGAVSPADAEARAVCTDLRRCGGEDYAEIIVPIPPDPGPPAPRAAMTLNDARSHVRSLGPRVDECFATHFEGARAPRTYAVTMFVHPDGRWSLAFGPRARAPRRDAELRGESPLEVCVADWIAGELGPRIQPPGGRADRRLAFTFHPHVAAAAPAPPAP